MDWEIIGGDDVWRSDGCERLREVGGSLSLAGSQSGSPTGNPTVGNLVIDGLPAMSRVENQMKLSLTLSGVGDRDVVLKLPRECVAKDRHLVEPFSGLDRVYKRGNPLVSARVLYLECYVLGLSEMQVHKDVQVCEMCVNREYRRSLRRKSGVSDNAEWRAHPARKAVIFNEKQLVEPRGATGDDTLKFELTTRIVCYCAHQAAELGFQLLFVVKDYRDTVLGAALAGPIMILDSKRINSLKQGQFRLTGNSNTDVSSTEYHVKRQKSASMSHTDNSSILTSLIPSDPYDSPASSISSAAAVICSGARRRTEPKPLNSTSQMFFDTPGAPEIKKIIPPSGPVHGGTEVTILGRNFRQGLNVRFGENLALVMTYWNDTTIVATSPITTTPGKVNITLEDEFGVPVPSRIPVEFTYFDDSDRQLIELALQVIGLRMNGKIENAKSIAWKIVGDNNSVALQSEF